MSVTTAEPYTKMSATNPDQTQKGCFASLLGRRGTRLCSGTSSRNQDARKRSFERDVVAAGHFTL